MKTKEIVTLMILTMLVATPSVFAGNSQEHDHDEIIAGNKSDLQTSIDAGVEKILYSGFDVEEESGKEDIDDKEN